MTRHTISLFLDQYMPDHQGGEDHAPLTADARVRARTLMGLYISCIVVTLASLVVFALLSWLDHTKSYLEAYGLLGAVLILLILQVVMYYRLGHVGVSAIVFSMFFFGGTFGAMILTGGWASPVRQLFFCAPIISFLIGGRHEGVYMTGIVLVSGLIMLGADHMQFQPMDLVTDDDRDLIAGIVWIISLVILVTCLTVYESILRDYSESRKRAR
jgi:hypothetical protein